MLKRESKIEILSRISEEVKSCKKCNLCKTRNNAVPGSGNVMSEIIVVGEAPGHQEDETGLPFVGRSGKLLDKVLEEFGVKRKDVMVLNIIKCRPPNNRDPLPEEIEECIPYLKKQLSIIEPKTIITLGRVATQILLDTEDKIGRLRGEWHEYQKIPLMPTYHPSYVLRNGKNGLPLELFKEDIKKAVKLTKNGY